MEPLPKNYNPRLQDKNILTQYRTENPWGMETQIDLQSCNPLLIRDPQKVVEYINALCQLIKMRKFQDTIVHRFGEDPRVTGLSFIQFIETSLISGHMAEESNGAYINIFSCKEYPPYTAAGFTASFFEAKTSRVTVQFRG